MKFPFRCSSACLGLPAHHWHQRIRPKTCPLADDAAPDQEPAARFRRARRLEELLCAALFMGADGGTLASAGVVPEVMMKIYDDAREGNWSESRACNSAAGPVFAHGGAPTFRKFPRRLRIARLQVGHARFRFPMANQPPLKPCAPASSACLATRLCRGGRRVPAHGRRAGESSAELSGHGKPSDSGCVRKAVINTALPYLSLRSLSAKWGHVAGAMKMRTTVVCATAIM